jgi:hypothetical protein
MAEQAQPSLSVRHDGAAAGGVRLSFDERRRDRIPDHNIGAQILCGGGTKPEREKGREGGGLTRTLPS